jgi:hypothetical protein
MLKPQFKSADFYFKILLLIFFLVLLVEVRSYPVASRRLPQLIAVVTSAFLLLSLILDFFPHTTEKEKPEVSLEVLRLTRKRFVFSSITVVLSVVVASIGGVLLAVPISFICLSLLFEGKKYLLKSIIISAVATGITYVVFGVFFGIPITEGMFW